MTQDLITGRFFISTGLRSWGHVLVAVHRRWRLAYCVVLPKDYRRIYIGPVEIEWSRRAHREGEGR